MLGFSEREIGHFTLKKWFLLFEHYKKYHNFKVLGCTFKDQKDDINPNGWIPF
nr:MAG TPA: hypothetical protein [Caudoviricetes sp.]